MGRFLSRLRLYRSKSRKAVSNTSSNGGHEYESTSPSDSKALSVLPNVTVNKNSEILIQNEADIYASSKDFWADAFRVLQQDEKNSKLITIYKEILSQELGVDAAALDDDRICVHISTFLESKSRLISDPAWTKTFQGKNAQVRAALDTVVKAVLYVKSFIGEALAAEPHASLVWAGLLVNVSQQPNDLVKGVDYISDLLCRFSVTERLYRSQLNSISTSKSSPDLRNLRNHFETALTQLYSKILRYQGQALYYMKYSTGIRLTRDMVKLDDWSSLIDEMKEQEMICVRSMEILDSDKLSNEIRGLGDRMQHLLDVAYAQYSANVALQQNAQEAVSTLKLEQKFLGDQYKVASKEECVRNFYTSPYEDHMNRNPDAVDGTCQWVLQNPTFTAWRDAESSSFLWISADPGCGKSVLAKMLVRLLSQPTEPNIAPERRRTVCYFFFKEDDSLQRSAENAVCALLHQLLSKDDNSALIGHALEEYQKAGSNLRSSFTRLWKIFIDAATDPQAGEVICILDALDECDWVEEGRGQSQLIDALRKFHRDYVEDDESAGRVRLKVLVTSRPYIDIERKFRTLTRRFPTLRLAGENESKQISKEIDVVVKERVKILGDDLDLPASTVSALETHLLTTTQRTYLWVRLIFDVLKEQLKTTEKHLLRVIDEIPDSVEAAYETILKRIPKREVPRARKLLHFVVAATRPLTVSEMNIALAMEEGCKEFEDLDLEPEQAFQATIRNICGLFITVVDSRIYLIHQTARSFLVSTNALADIPHPAERSLQWGGSLEPKDSHRLLGTVCINYLLLTDFKITTHFTDPSSLEVDPADERSFLLYSAGNWWLHVQNMDEEEIEKPTLQDSIYELCQTDTGTFKAWFGLARKNLNKPLGMSLDINGREDFHLLEIGSLLGLENIVRHAKGLPGVKEYFLFSIRVAASHGYDKVIRIILDEEEDLDLDLDGPFKDAIPRRKLSVAQALIDGGAGKDNHYEEALDLAISCCFVELVELLADRGVNLKRSLPGGMSLLMPSLYAVDMDMLSCLIKRGVTPNDLYGSPMSPLSWAVSWNSVVLTSFLIQNGADVDLAGSDNWKPIDRALTGEDVSEGFRQRYGSDEEYLVELSRKDMVISLLLENGAGLKGLDDSKKEALSGYRRRQAKREEAGTTLESHFNLRLKSETEPYVLFDYSDSDDEDDGELEGSDDL
ncbi:hypothetical protein Plec18167_007543 [Paecilomyces lecythidis]|uniref:NWD NACHT-NTPase N-terminal domain-containing protein n=1 Tax=Paecilomyces lecythidis TaxID=3004212 RepID=A0ABR3X2D7_9EURO